MKQKCKFYLTVIKGRIQPGCSCNSCWDLFFRVNPGKYEGAKLALEQFGIENLIQSQIGQFKAAKIVNPEWQLRAQATRFAKQVQRRMRHDHPLNRCAHEAITLSKDYTKSFCVDCKADVTALTTKVLQGPEQTEASS